MSQTVLLPIGTVIDINPPNSSTPGWRIGQIKEIGHGGLRKIRFGDIGVNGTQENHFSIIITLI